MKFSRPQWLPILSTGLFLTASVSLLGFAPSSSRSALLRDHALDGLPKLVRGATAAVNARDFEALKPFTEGEVKANFGWIKETTTKKWQSGLLTPPKTTEEGKPTSAEQFIVFHEWHTCESDGDHIHRVVKDGAGGDIKLGEEIKETDPFGLRVRHHELQIHVDAPAKHLYATDTVTFEVLPGERKPYGLFRISSDYKIQELKLGTSSGEAVPFQQVGGIVAFQLPTEDKFVLYLKYDGVVDHNGSDYFRSDEATINSYFYPHTARQPATATITLTSPAEWKGVAIGELVSTKVNDDKTETATFKNDLPVVFYTVDMGKYKVTERNYKGRKIATYLLSDNPALPDRCLDLLQKSLDYFETNFGKHPYSRYAVVETKGPFGGALEAYSFATFGAFTLPGTIVHELSHTWWGGVVPSSYTRSMWNESFAEYSDELFQRSQGLEKTPPEERLLQSRQRRARAFQNWTMTKAHDTSDNAQASVGYGKGPLVLRVLEDEIGKPVMLKAMQTFYKSYPTGNSAEWSDFEKIVNIETRGDYRWFFSQWMERTGLPTAQLKNVLLKKVGSGFIVTGDIEQTAPIYRLKLPLQLKTALGETTQVIVAKDALTHFTLKSRTKPTRLFVDPQDNVPLTLSAGKGNPLIYKFK